MNILYSSLTLLTLPVSNIRRLAVSLLQRVHYFIRCFRETRIGYHWAVHPYIFLFSLNNQNSKGRVIYSHSINIFLWKQKILTKLYRLFQNNEWLSRLSYWNSNQKSPGSNPKGHLTGLETQPRYEAASDLRAKIRKICSD